MARRLVSAVVGSALLLLGPGCGGDPEPSPAGGATITIDKLEFLPDTLRVKVGDTVTVENKDAAEHTVTAVDGSFDTGRFGAGTKTFVVTTAGRFEYFCVVHPFMAHRIIQVAP